MCAGDDSVGRRAATDITSGWGFDCNFRFGSNEYKDPWAETCLADLTDVVVNHETVVVPLPSKQALNYASRSDPLQGSDEADRPNLPQSIQEACRRNLLRLETSASAEEIKLPSDRIAAEYDRFTEWCQREPTRIRDFVLFHRYTPETRNQNEKYVPLFVTDEFWQSCAKDRLRAAIGLSDGDLNYAFDTYVRTIQYHVLLEGRAWYFRHPYRRFAMGSSDGENPLRCTSWGQCLVNGIHQGFIPQGLMEVMDLVDELHRVSTKTNTTWYTLIDEPESRRIQAMHDIAQSLGLPGKLKDSVVRTLQTFLGVAALAPESYSFMAKVAFSAGVLLAEAVKGKKLPPFVTKVGVFQGMIDRPYLPALPKVKH